MPAITIRDLLRATLRHRPDGSLVGEVRGGEAFDLLQALNTGQVHLERRRGRRVVTELVRVRQYNPGTDTYDLESL